MNTSIVSTQSNASRLVPLAAIVALILAFTQLQARAASPTPAASNSDATLRQQITELQAKVKKLEGAASPQPMPSTSPSMPGMGSSPSGAAMNMGMGEMNMSGMQNKPTPGGGMMDMMSMMGQMNMSAMPSGSPGMSGMSGMPQSALPGFPGVSHLYHIGSTGFFLDHADHIGLSPDQRSALNQIKEQALASKTHSEHQIERAEQELGELTSADQPNAAQIEQKVREIEKLRSDERLAFIKAVGNAANLLTDDQRKILVGAMQPNSAMPSSSPSMSPMEHM